MVLLNVTSKLCMYSTDNGVRIKLHVGDDSAEADMTAVDRHALALVGLARADQLADASVLGEVQEMLGTMVRDKRSHELLVLMYKAEGYTTYATHSVCMYVVRNVRSDSVRVCMYI